MDICFRKLSDICLRKCLVAFTLPQEPRARTGPETISSILCIVYLPRRKGAAAKRSFRCRAFQRWGLRWPCCASSQTVLSSLSVQCSLGAEAHCKAFPWCATAVITDSRPPDQGDSVGSYCHRRAGRSRVSRRSRRTARADRTKKRRHPLSSPFRACPVA